MKSKTNEKTGEKTDGKADDKKNDEEPDTTYISVLESKELAEQR